MDRNTRASADPRAQDWLAPTEQQRSLPRFLKIVRDRWWLIALLPLVTLAAAVAYLATAEKTYTASADMLVTPVSSQNDLAFGLAVIRESNDPTRDVSTAARLVENVAVASRVKRRLGRAESPQALLDSIEALPVAQSSVVTVTGSANDPAAAASIANAFATQAVRERTVQFHAQIDAQVASLRARIDQIGREGVSQTDLVQRVSRLLALRGAPDPTLRVVTQALAPRSATRPQPALTLVAGGLVGVILGLGAAFGIQAIDPRLRREEQLRELYNLPVLARVPREGKRRRQWLLPERISGGTLESFRMLSAILAVNRPHDTGRGRSVLVTGAGPGEGKSTTALNYAYALAKSGHRVILLEADVYRPTLAAGLEMTPRLGTESVLLRTASMAEALTESERYGPNLKLLLAGGLGAGVGDPLGLATAKDLVAEAESLADYVVIDAPPLTEVSDVLPLAVQATDIVLVVRLGKTRLPKMRRLGEMLAHHDLRPAGVVLVGVRVSGKDTYYQYREEPKKAKKAKRKQKNGPAEPDTAAEREPVLRG